MAKPLWDKGHSINQRMHALTVGSDYLLDRKLMPFDCIGSAAHARMLHSIGILDRSECAGLLAELKLLFSASSKGEYEISPELEDCHSAIELALTDKLGESAKKIHTGRSRNDQVALALRLYLRENTLAGLETLSQLINVLVKRYDELRDVLMPGYTHMQPAMPSSIGLWLHAQVEACLDLIAQGLRLYERADSNPLGAAASYGSSLPLDRNLVAKLLGFSRVDRSVLDVQNARGRLEEHYLFWASQIGGVFEKFSSDMALFMTREFNFFGLPTEMTTGSSIMPNKKNPDLIELLRAKASRIRACMFESSAILAKLPSGYNRDQQLSKESFMRGVTELQQGLEMYQLALTSFTVNKERLQTCMYPELYSTYSALRKVKAGSTFRDAYREVASNLTDSNTQASDLKTDFNGISQESENGFRAAAAEFSRYIDKLGQLRSQQDQVVQGVFRL